MGSYRGTVSFSSLLWHRETDQLDLNPVLEF